MFVLGHSLQVQFVAGKGRHGSRKQRKGSAWALLDLSFFSDQYPPHGMVPLTFRVDLPSSVNLSGHIFTVKLKTNHYSDQVCFVLNKKENTEDLTVLKCPSYSVKKY